MFDVAIFIVGATTFFLALYAVIRAAIKDAILEIIKEIDSRRE